MSASTTSIARIRMRERRVPYGASGRVLRSPFGVVALTWLVILIAASLSAPLWLPYGPNENDLAAVLQGPSAAHWLGTDEVGRDILARVVTAAASTLALACVAPIVALLVTVPVVLVASRSKVLEAVANRVSEIMMSLPGTVIILAFIAAVGREMLLVMVLLGILMFGGLYRILIGQARSLHKQLFVDAAAVDGVRPFSASLRHVLPNMGSTVTVQFVLIFGIGIMMQAGLAFIGFGPQPPEPTWGGMIQAASRFIFQQPWMMIPTGGVLALTLIAANGLADILSGGNATPPPLVALRRRRAGVSSSAVPAENAPSTPSGELVIDKLVISLDDGPDLVTGVSLSIKPGRVTGLVGESGCGKSVTAYAILGLLSPGLSVTSGRILWGSVDLAIAEESTMARVRGHEIAYISQEPTRALDPMFTVGWQLATAVRRLRSVGRAEARRIAASLLDDVGIVDPARVLRLYPHEISGGMAQRVAIALALAGQPRLLIADEPTTALDVTVQAEILALLRELVTGRDMSILLVTHDLGVVADLCDEVAVMYAGQLVETGSVRDVLTRAEQPYTMGLLASNPHAAMQITDSTHLASIPGQVPAPGSWPTGCRFAPRCRFATEACSVPIPLEPRRLGIGQVRCIRHDDVIGRQAEWITTDAKGDAS